MGPSASKEDIRLDLLEGGNMIINEQGTGAPPTISLVRASTAMLTCSCGLPRGLSRKEYFCVDAISGDALILLHHVTTSMTAVYTHHCR